MGLVPVKKNKNKKKHLPADETFDISKNFPRSVKIFCLPTGSRFSRVKEEIKHLFTHTHNRISPVKIMWIKDGSCGSVKSVSCAPTAKDLLLYCCRYQLDLNKKSSNKCFILHKHYRIPAETAVNVEASTSVCFLFPGPGVRSGLHQLCPVLQPHR